MQYGQFAMMVEKMRSEKHLLLHSPDSLLAQWQAGLSVVHCESDQIVAHVTLWPLVEEWFELGNIWVDPTRRGHGCGNRVMAEVLGKHEHIMLTSTNPVCGGCQKNMVCVRCNLPNCRRRYGVPPVSVIRASVVMTTFVSVCTVITPVVCI